MTALDRLDRYEQWLSRARQTPRETIRELEAIAASLRAPVPPSPPRYISREDLEISAAVQRCIRSLERMNRAAERTNNRAGGRESL